MNTTLFLWTLVGSRRDADCVVPRRGPVLLRAAGRLSTGRAPDTAGGCRFGHTVDPELVRNVLLTRLALGLRTKQTTDAEADMLRLLEHAVRVNGVEVVP